jgi:hypothetical protein
MARVLRHWHIAIPFIVGKAFGVDEPCNSIDEVLIRLNWEGNGR